MQTPEKTLPALNNPMSFSAFKLLTDNLVLLQQTSGPEQTEERIAFTRLNQQRMKRVEKQFELLPELHEQLGEIDENWQWLVLAETWCGDGAQLIPAIAAIAAANPVISLSILLRDENPELMDRHLTNGGRAIPKLICLDADTKEVLFTWGPRPSEIQQKVVAFKAENPDAGKEELHAQLALWYAKDKGLALQHDLLQLIKQAIEKTPLAI